MMSYGTYVAGFQKGSQWLAIESHSTQPCAKANKWTDHFKLYAGLSTLWIQVYETESRA